MSKQEIAEALAHQQKMLGVLRQRLQQRELQEAQYGLNVPPEVVIDVHDLTDRIQRHEGELARLQTLAAEDEIPLVEAEYRVLLAETWGTPEGRPTVAGAARLELARLRLGITPDRAKEIEWNIRARLVEEAFFKIKSEAISLLGDLKAIAGDEPKTRTTAREKKQMEDTLQLLSRTIQLGPLTAARLLAKYHNPNNPPDVEALRYILFDIDHYWVHKNSRPLLQSFFAELEAALARRESQSSEDKSETIDSP